ncbi:MAG: hypothetical protein M3443_13580 [Actinomycetota bacterium]|nr:hypothetical protein [Actinomycetota bacterium]
MARSPAGSLGCGRTRRSPASQDEPAMAVDPWGLITLAYTDDNDGNGFAQIYLGTGLNNSTW